MIQIFLEPTLVLIHNQLNDVRKFQEFIATGTMKHVNGINYFVLNEDKSEIYKKILERK